MIPILTDADWSTAADPVVAIDGEILFALETVATRAEESRLSCVGVCVDNGSAVAFWQTVGEMVHLEDLDTLADQRPDVVVVGPTALLGALVDDVVAKIRRLLPGTLIACATGVLIDPKF